jgi:hypothetical protein
VDSDRLAFISGQSAGNLWMEAIFSIDSSYFGLAPFGHQPPHSMSPDSLIEGSAICAGLPAGYYLWKVLFHE